MKLKNIPSEITKSILTAMYQNQFTHKQIRNMINTIIKDNRKNEPLYQEIISRGQTPCVQKIREKEFLEFTAVYGWPKGFEKPEKINS